MKRRITFNSPVVLSFVIISFGAMIANYLTAGVSNQLLFVTYHSSLASPMTYVRFFTHVLGHASWQHYFSNIMYILLLGPMLEEKYGSRAILGGMAVGLFYSNLTYLEFYRQMTTTTTINDLLVGLVTSFVFGVLISICGCYQGIKCGRNSTAVGQAATSAVVASIICMTIASAIITVLTVILKL